MGNSTAKVAIKSHTAKYKWPGSQDHIMVPCGFIKYLIDNDVHKIVIFSRHTGVLSFKKMDEMKELGRTFIFKTMEDELGFQLMDVIHQDLTLLKIPFNGCTKTYWGELLYDMLARDVENGFVWCGCWLVESKILPSMVGELRLKPDDMSLLVQHVYAVVNEDMDSCTIETCDLDQKGEIYEIVKQDGKLIVPNAHPIHNVIDSIYEKINV